jgi:hypothetical protein
MCRHVRGYAAARRNTLETTDVDLNFSVGLELCRGQQHRLLERRSATIVNATVQKTAAQRRI